MDKLRIGIFGETPITNKESILSILEEHISSWIHRQAEEVRPSHVEIVGISETRGVVEIAKEFAAARGYCYFQVPLQEQRYKTAALWMRNAHIIERIDQLLIIKRPKKSPEYLRRLETKARENKCLVVTAFLNEDETLSTFSR